MLKHLTNKRTCMCVCNRKIDDLPVKNGLAITPSEMARLASQGIPITSGNLPFVDGDKYPSWDVLPENVRGVDVAELWTMQQEARSRIKAAHRRDRANNNE